MSLAPAGRTAFRPSLHLALLGAGALLAVGAVLALATTSPQAGRLGLALVIVALGGAGAVVVVDLGGSLRARWRWPAPPGPPHVPLLRPGRAARPVDLASSTDHLRRGAAAFDAGRPADAAAELGLALDLDPRNPGGYALLGRALVADGRPEVAAAAFRAALGQEPALVAARAGLAEALLLDGDAEAACDAAGDATGRPPLATVRARALRALDRDAEAEAALAAVGGPGAAIERARQHLVAGRPADARAELLTAHGQAPDDAEVLVLLGALHRFEGRAHQAQACFAAGLGARPGGRTPWRRAELEAAALFGLGRAPEATACLAAAARRRCPGEAPDLVLIELLAEPADPVFEELAGRWRAA